MRKYTTPTLEVVKLLVREDMAAKKVTGISGTYDGDINTTTYTLTSDIVSEANGNSSEPEEPGE
jgi:hypothetical protein